MFTISRFNEISKQKFILVENFLNDQDLMKAIIYDSPDFLYKPDIPYDEAKNYVFDRIYPQRFIPGTPSTQKTYLTISFEDYRPTKDYYKSGRVRISAFTHHSLYSSVDGFLRIDFIMEKIDEILNNKRGLGIGKTNFLERNPITVTSEYHGEYISYKIVDFN